MSARRHGGEGGGKRFCAKAACPPIEVLSVSLQPALLPALTSLVAAPLVSSVVAV